MDMIKLPSMNLEKVSKEIQSFILNTVGQQKKSGVVLGLSGGIDSSVVAVLCQRAFKDTLHQVTGYYLPYRIDDEDKDCVETLAYRFNLVYNTIPIYYLCNGHINLIEQHTGVELSDFDRGNLCSRVRANVLSTLSAQENKVLCGTGNHDEDYGVGYYTLFGDGAVHMNPIGCLSKRLVYEMANFLDIPLEIITKFPSAGLEPGQTDYGDLGYSYDTIEIVIEAMNQGITVTDLVSYLYNVNITYDATKFRNVHGVIEDILARNMIAISKAEIIHPPVPKVSLDYI